MNDIKSALIHPTKLWTRNEVLSPENPVPKKPGIYAWYFKLIPVGVPIEGCIRFNGLTLLYVGISPKAPPLNGAPPSSQNLNRRIRYHMRGNAEGSTLRLTLGCLLKDQLGIQLRRVCGGNRKTFASGEVALSEWMSENAFVTCVACDEPWICEAEIIPQLSLPLNIQHNNMHPFYKELKTIRSDVKRSADLLPIIPR